MVKKWPKIGQKWSKMAKTMERKIIKAFNQ